MCTYFRTNGVFLGVDVRLDAGIVLIVNGDKGGSSSLQKEWKEGCGVGLGGCGREEVKVKERSHEGSMRNDKEGEG